MTNAGQASGKILVRPVIFGIHGVGNARVGEVEVDIYSNLVQSESRTGAVISEINWNRITEKALDEAGNMRGQAMKVLARGFLNASLMDPEIGVLRESGKSCSSLLDVREWLFLLSDALITVSFLILVAIPGMLISCEGVSQPLLRDNSVVIAWVRRASLTSSEFAFGFALVPLAGYLLLTGLRSVTLSNWSALNVGIRRSLTLLIRPAVFVIIFPLLIPWRSLALMGWKKWCLLGAWLVGFAITSILFYNPGSFGTVFSRRFFLEGFADLLKLGIIIAVILASALILAYAASGFLKVLLDIFRYACDWDYRDKIQAAVLLKVKAVRSISPTADFYLVAHSLGTVIAVDALLNTDAFGWTDSITLITLGSPLRRFFFRFFPRLFFPDHAAECAKQLAGRYTRFRWINCYRPLDQIGTRLNLPQLPWLTEISTGQLRKFAGAHVDYWSDKVVRECLLTACKGVGFSSEAPRIEDTSSQPPVKSERRIKMTKALWRILIPALAVAVPVIGLVASAKIHWHNATLLAVKQARIRSEGIEAIADMKLDFIITGQTQDGLNITDTLLTFDYKDAKGVTRRVDFRESAFAHLEDPSRTTLNVVGLSAAANQNGGRLKGIRIRFLPDDPYFIYVPEYPPDPKYGLHHALTSIILCAATTALIAMLAGATYLIGGWIAELFLGQRVTSL